MRYTLSLEAFKILQAEIKKTSITAVAKRIGYKRTSVSLAYHGKADAYIAMVIGKRSSSLLIKNTIENTVGQAEKLAAADAIVAAFKDQVTGG